MFVSVHTYLELRLHVSSTDIPIVVDLAAVRWVRDGHLGVEFLSMQPEHQARLQQIIEQAGERERDYLMQPFQGWCFLRDKNQTGHWRRSYFVNFV